jgi:hypothetical protein
METKKCFAYYFLELHLHQFAKIRSHKEVTAGSGSVLRTSGSGSRSIWILRIRIRTRNTAKIKLKHKFVSTYLFPGPFLWRWYPSPPHEADSLPNRVTGTYNQTYLNFC